jgi:hypothetical protein
MAKLRVVYTVQHIEYIEWPDDELEHLDYDNLICNLDFDNAKFRDFDDVINIKKDGEEFYF